MNSQLSRSEAASLLLRRRTIRASLTEWARHRGFEPARHHAYLVERLEAVARGDIDRLAVFMPPGSAKSTYASVVFPPWYLARHPSHGVIAASHTVELAEKFGRKVRNAIGEDGPTLGLTIQADNSAAGRWALTSGGEYLAAGVGVGIAGFRADLGIIDDPIRSREDADSERVRQKIWDWYSDDFLTRLKPGARVVLIQCMTGDTQVMLANGKQKSLRDIRVGDLVATFEAGRLRSSKVVNWTSNGLDRVYRIKTKSGITVKANARHPFLVVDGNTTKWTKTRDLRPGLEMLRANGASGAASSVSMRGVKSPSPHAGIALRITTKSDGLTVFDRLRSTLRLAAARICGIVTALPQKISTACLRFKTADALFAGSRRAIMSAPIGAGSCALITATTPVVSAHFSVTTATSWLGTQSDQKSPKRLPGIYDFTPDEIVEISECGVEEVFDLQVEGTENFIANGLVSHNTRWHEDDLAGRILNARDAARWSVVKLPAFAVEGDPLGRDVGEPLWSDGEYGYGAQLSEARPNMTPRTFSALYQQEPAPDTGDLFRAEWLRPYETMPNRDTLRIYGASDYAVTDNGGDYTVHVVVGMDPQGDLWLLDLWRGQTDPSVWVDQFCDMVRKWRPVEWAEETGQIRSGIGPFREQRMRERGAFVAMKQFPTRGDKVVRATSIRGRMALRGLYCPANEPWFADLRSELLRFPAGAHDDQVDALGLVGQLLDTMTPGRDASEPTRPRPRAVRGGWMAA